MNARRKEVIDNFRNLGYEIVEILHRGAAIMLNAQSYERVLVDAQGNVTTLR